jgi:putative acetyltransferase
MPSPAPAESSLSKEVAALRDSSRRLVRVLGLMRNRLDGADCTPAQCHALIELARLGQLTTGELAEILEVDKSTASRTVRPLITAGLIQVSAEGKDRRTKPLRLSEAGRARVACIHAEADRQVSGALERLSAEERAIALQGISLYERALHRAKALTGVRVRRIEPRDDRAMADLIRGVMREFEAVGAGYSSSDAEVDAMERAYRGARHAYFVAERDGVILAGGGIAPLRGQEGDDVCELRKMHALPAARGLGIGRLLLEHCLAFARQAGYRLCYLETLSRMQRARALYEKFGFQARSAPLGDTGHFTCDSWYALEL